MIQIRDGLLDDLDLKRLQDILLGHEFPWHFLDHTIHEGKDNINDYQMTHQFYTNEGFGRPCSNYFDLMMPILIKLNTSILVRIKANLRLVAPQKDMIAGYHTDIIGEESSKITTAIFYVNTNNGYTLFKDTQKKVDSIENRLVIFPTNTEHCGVSCTDIKQRVVINFNYIQMLTSSLY
tara:strand:- start:132 stop:668 length:537 start_codon:yes stop_codon:yes gene_type:complete